MSAGEVLIDLFDAVNNTVAVLVDQTMQPGSYTATFDTHDLPSGLYLYRIRTGSVVETKNFVVVR